MGLFGSKTTGGDVRMRTNLFDFFLPGLDKGIEDIISSSTGDNLDPMVRKANENIAGLADYVKNRSADLRKSLVGQATAGAESAVIAAAQAGRRARGSRGAVGSLAARAAATSSGARTAGISQGLAQATAGEIQGVTQANALFGQQAKFIDETSAAGIRRSKRNALFSLLNTGLGGVGQVTASQLQPGSSLFSEIAGGIGALTGGAKNLVGAGGALSG